MVAISSFEAHSIRSEIIRVIEQCFANSATARQLAKLEDILEGYGFEFEDVKGLKEMLRRLLDERDYEGWNRDAIISACNRYCNFISVIDKYQSIIFHMIASFFAIHVDNLYPERTCRTNDNKMRHNLLAKGKLENFSIIVFSLLEQAISDAGENHFNAHIGGAHVVIRTDPDRDDIPCIRLRYTLKRMMHVAKDVITHMSPIDNEATAEEFGNILGKNGCINVLEVDFVERRDHFEIVYPDLEYFKKLIGIN